jgi:outer membrane protein assembly factor BamB
VNPPLLWVFPNPNITSVPIDNNHVLSTAAVANGYLYVGGANRGGFYCLNASTGRQIWSNPNMYVAASFSTPAFSDGYLYVSISGLITALDASTGAAIWSTNFTNVHGNPESGWSPTVVDGVVYVGGYSAFYALNAMTGVTIWKYGDNRGFTGFMTSSPAVADGYVYAVGNYHDYDSGGNYEGYIYALNASTGHEIWNNKIGQVPYSSPTVYARRVYVGSDDGNIYAFDASTGSSLWNYTTGSSVAGSPAAAKDFVYIGSRNEQFYAFNASTGKVVWSTFVSSGVSSSAAVAGDVIYVSSSDCNLYAFDASTGTQLWKYLTINASDYWAASATMYASPAVAYGNIYIGTNEGNVLAFGKTSQTIPPSTPPSTSLEVFLGITVGVIVLVISSVLIAKKWMAKKQQQETPNSRH